MNTGTTTRGRRPLSPQQREERAHRILDAAGELVLRWGYGKTTIDDVARTADVAKGTIYQHWKSREDLFAALLRRDRAAMAGHVRRRLHAEPEAASVARLFTELTRELHCRPLVRAAVLQDADVLGRLTARKRADHTSATMLEPLGEYLDTLRTCGAIRPDLTTPEVLTVVSSLLYGSLTSARMLPAAAGVSENRSADLLGDAVARFLEPGGAPSPAARATAAAATRKFVDGADATARSKFQESLGGDVLPGEEAPA